MTDLLFVHNPKAAGLSFLHSLGAAYGECREIWDFIPGHSSVIHEIDSPFYRDHHWYRQKIKEAELEADKHRVVYGHIPVWTLDGPLYFAPKVIWLRNPVDLVLSRIFHFRKENLIGTREVDPMLLVHWPVFQNNQFLYAGGDLSVFSYVGIVEHYDLCHTEIAEMFNWPDHVRPVHVHATDWEPELRQSLRENAAFCAEIERLNALDYALYDYVLGERGWK